MVILGAPAPAARPVKKRKGMSAAGRARIAAAQKAQWAKIKAAKKDWFKRHKFNGQSWWLPLLLWGGSTWNLPIRQVLGSICVCQSRIFCAYMKKIYAAKSNKAVISQHRSFRRFVKKMVGSILKHQNPDVIKRLQNLEYKVEMMARVMSRQTRRKR